MPRVDRSKLSHTPEPWTIAEADYFGNYTRQIRSSDGDDVAKCSYEARRRNWDIDKLPDVKPGKEHPVVRAELNAARIVACVNACAGMKDPAVEIAELKETAAKYASLSR